MFRFQTIENCWLQQIRVRGKIVGMSVHCNAEITKSRQLQNDQIIGRLKSKYRPLQQQRDNMFPNIKSRSTHDNANAEQFRQCRKIKQFIDIRINAPELITLDEHHPVIDRAQDYIREYRRHPQNSEHVPARLERLREKANMQKYLSLLGVNNSQQNSKINDKSTGKAQFLKQKVKEEMELFNQKQPYFMAHFEMDNHEEKQDYNQENARQFNAKIRQKYNHKKMIALYR